MGENCLVDGLAQHMPLVKATGHLYARCGSSLLLFKMGAEAIMSDAAREYSAGQQQAGGTELLNDAHAVSSLRGARGDFVNRLAEDLEFSLDEV